MEIIATLPPPHMAQIDVVAKHELINGARFNVGARTPYSPKETLERILDKMKGKRLWVDLKGRQLRIVQWAVPTYGDIVLNHEIEVDLPAEIFFRGDQKSCIRNILNNKIYVEPNPPQAVGAGQAVNVHGSNLKIKGYLTEEDNEYIAAAKELGIHDYMLSFVEKEQDIKDVLSLDQEASMVAKIESLAGLAFVAEEYSPYKEYVRLMAARDDLYINIGEDKLAIFGALELIINRDPDAIVASRILESLKSSEVVSLSDLSDLRLMESMGYQRFMLSDGLCFNQKAFLDAMDIMEKYLKR